MIYYPNGLTVAGYKSIRDRQRIEIRNLTVISGPNSAGKSSLLQPMLLLKQTLDAPFDPDPLLINGPNVSFAWARQMFWSGDHAEGENPEMTIGSWDSDGDMSDLVFRLTPNGLELDRTEFKYSEASSRTRTLRPGMDRQRIQRVIPDENLQPFARLPRHLTLKALRRRCFIDVVVIPRGTHDLAEGLASTTPAISLRLAASDLIHVPGMRDAPSRYYPTTPIGSRFTGVFQDHVGSLLAAWTSGKDSNLEQLGDQLRRMGLTCMVSATPIDDTRVSLEVGRFSEPRKGAVEMINIADVGLGVSQTLPVLTALLAAKAGQWVVLEQPEIHLHPRAQVALGRVLADAAVRGVRVVTETHSPLLIKSIQHLVASGELDAEQVILHWASRAADGATMISSATLDNRGTFGDWPSDFGSVEMEIEELFLDAALSEKS